jgi:hypothetical protein
VTNRPDELADVLAELRQQHRRVEAPAHLEGRLRAAAGTHRKRPLMRRRVWSMAAALIVIALIVWRAGRPGSTRLLPAPAGEHLTEFVALPGSEMLPPPLETSVLRLRLRKGELRRYGFEIPPPMAGEFIRADFVIGDDGLARAIRFSRQETEGSNR